MQSRWPAPSEQEQEQHEWVTEFVGRCVLFINHIIYSPTFFYSPYSKFIDWEFVCSSYLRIPFIRNDRYQLIAVASTRTSRTGERKIEEVLVSDNASSFSLRDLIVPDLQLKKIQLLYQYSTQRLHIWPGFASDSHRLWFSWLYFIFWVWGRAVERQYGMLLLLNIWLERTRELLETLADWNQTCDAIRIDQFCVWALWLRLSDFFK